jgi:c-di-GMP-binding flagellar brake protein YcgR
VNRLKDISGTQVEQAFRIVADRQLPVAVAAKHQDMWFAFRSRALAIRDGKLWIEMPPADNEYQPHEIIPGNDCSVSFRIGTYRYFFKTALQGPDQWRLADGSDVAAFSTAIPTSLHQLERRVHERVDVPSGKMLRAVIWVGEARKPMWSGTVLNISMGGFQMRTVRTVTNFLETGDLVNVNIAFDADSPPLPLEAHYRHGQPDGNMALLGFEFLPLMMTDEGRKLSELIRQKIEQLKHTETDAPQATAATAVPQTA